MDSFFDGSFLKLLVPIIMVLLFSLPDFLRKRCKYPPKQRPLPPPTEQQPKEEKKAKSTAPIPDEELPDIAKPRREQRKAPTAPAKPIPEPVTPPAPKVKRPVVQPKPVPQVAAIQAQQPTPAAVPHIVHGQPWGELPPEARDIYAGLVWSELLSPPVALRRKK